jgi:hypothetical protein
LRFGCCFAHCRTMPQQQVAQKPMQAACCVGCRCAGDGAQFRRF